MRRNLVTVGVVALLGLGLSAGCKGKTKYQDTKETTEKLASLETQLKDKDTYIQKLRDENAELQRGGVVSDSEWLFTIEGDALVLKAKPSGGGGPAIDDATATAMSNQFLDLVSKSRGSIQKCYEQALKKDSNLQSKTVTLTVSATFSNQGAYQSSSFNASANLGDVFDNCMKQIAQKWALPQNSPAMTFKAQVSLTPS